jgi:hypothetical protein
MGSRLNYKEDRLVIEGTDVYIHLQKGSREWVASLLISQGEWHIIDDNLFKVIILHYPCDNDDPLYGDWYAHTNREYSIFCKCDKPIPEEIKFLCKMSK